MPKELIAPFAAFLEKIGDTLFDDTCVLTTNPMATAQPGDITVGDLRRLVAAIPEA